MSNHIHEHDDIAGIQHRQVAANAELRAKLLTGDDTAMTRKEIDRLARDLIAKVAAVAVTEQERAEMRQKAHKVRVNKRSKLIHEEIASRLAALDPHTKEAK